MSLPARPSPSQLDYLVGWICIIPEEHYAALEILDEKYASTNIVPAQGDQTSYILGRVGDHDVVINVPATTNYGELHASVIAKNMKSTFPQIRFVLLVGIGGGIPLRHDIRLGDVVLGTQVIPYAFGKETDHGFVRTGRVASPPECLLVALTTLEGRRRTREIHISRCVDTISARHGSEPNYYSRPREDRLYESQYRHDERHCDCLKPKAELISRILPRRVRGGDLVQMHKGNIGTANIVMKNAEVRDKLAVQEQLICFEMEATGVMLNVPCLPIRGISDYADGHKNDSWQPYAALAAAVCAKELLATMSRQTVFYAPLELEGPTLENFVNGVLNGRFRDGDDLGTIRSRLEALDGRHRVIEERLATELENLTDASQNLNQVRGRVAELECLHQRLQTALGSLGKEVQGHLDVPTEKDFVTRKEWEALHNQVQQHATRFEELSSVTQGALGTTSELLGELGERFGNKDVALSGRLLTYANQYTAHLTDLGKRLKNSRQTSDNEPSISAGSDRETTFMDKMWVPFRRRNPRPSPERAYSNPSGTYSTSSTSRSVSPFRHPEPDTEGHRARSPPSATSSPAPGRAQTRPLVSYHPTGYSRDSVVSPFRHPEPDTERYRAGSPPSATSSLASGRAQTRPLGYHPTGYSRDSVQTNITAPTETDLGGVQLPGVSFNVREAQKGMWYNPTPPRCPEDRTAQPSIDRNSDDEEDPSRQSVKEKIEKFQRFGGRGGRFQPNRG